MVNIRFNDVRPVAPVNTRAEENVARGRSGGRGSRRAMGRGRGRVSPTRDGASVYMLPEIRHLLHIIKRYKRT